MAEASVTLNEMLNGSEEPDTSSILGVSRWIKPSSLLHGTAAGDATLRPGSGWSAVALALSSQDVEVERDLRDGAGGTDTKIRHTARVRSEGGIADRSSIKPYRPSRSIVEICEWCRQPLGPRNQSGRRRVYCSQSCRQRAYQARKRASQLGLREGELVVSSVLVARMNRRLQALEFALLEVEMAKLDTSDERVYRLCTAARRLRRMVVGPPTR
jgi:hypothetical protein